MHSDLYAANYKMLRKEVKKKLVNMSRDIPCSHRHAIGRLNKLTYKFNVIPKKILAIILEIDWLILQFLRNTQASEQVN